MLPCCSCGIAQESIIKQIKGSMNGLNGTYYLPATRSIIDFLVNRGCPTLSGTLSEAIGSMGRIRTHYSLQEPYMHSSYV